MVEVTINENDKKCDYNDIADKVDRLIKKVEAVEAEPQVRNESFDDYWCKHCKQSHFIDR